MHVAHPGAVLGAATRVNALSAEDNLGGKGCSYANEEATEEKAQGHMD